MHRCVLAEERRKLELPEAIGDGRRLLSLYGPKMTPSKTD